MPSVVLRDRLGHVFRRPELLAHALTHRSHGAAHNERLEFVGDAVLNCAIAAALFERFPGDPRRRAFARPREPRQPRHAGARRARIDARTRDPSGRGRGAQRRRRTAVDPRRCARGSRSAPFSSTPASTPRAPSSSASMPRSSSDLDPAALGKDPKTRLQEWLQARRVAGAGVRGDRHRRRGACADVRRSNAGFRHCHVVANGSGTNRRAAEQAAAAAAFTRGLCRDGRHRAVADVRNAATFRCGTWRSSVARASASRRCSIALVGAEGQHHVEKAADDAPPDHAES